MAGWEAVERAVEDGQPGEPAGSDVLRGVAGVAK